jgi:hypothetical protein
MIIILERTMDKFSYRVKESEPAKMVTVVNMNHYKDEHSNVVVIVVRGNTGK